MACSATVTALDLPELLTSILEHLEDDGKALLAVALVNKLWSTIALGILWRHAFADKLCRLPQRQRRLRASRVRKLQFRCQSKAYSRLPHLDFPRLQNVHFQDVKLPKVWSWLGQISEKRRLRLLSIRDLRDAHLGMLSEVADLNKIAQEVSIRKCSAYYSPDLDYLASIEGLKDLGLQHAMLLPDNTEYYARILSRLTELSISLKHDDVPSLFSLVNPLVKRLSIKSCHPKDPPTILLRMLPRFTELTKLRLHLDTTVHEEDLLAVARFSKLHCVRIESSRAPPPLGGPWRLWQDHSRFEQMAQALPDLKHFTLRTHDIIPPYRALAMLAKHCRKLTKCVMPGTFDLDALQDLGVQPALPALTRLEIDNFTRAEEPAIKRDDAGILRKHAPRLFPDRAVYSCQECVTWGCVGAKRKPEKKC